MFNIIKYQLYLLQLENYEIFRYFKLILKKGIIPSKSMRSKLVWTGKAKVILILSLVIHLFGAKIISLGVWHFTHNFWLSIVIYVLALIILTFFHFIFHGISVFLLSPIHLYLKNKIVAKARIKISSLPNLKVIGIAGSYGKTSMKEALKSALCESFKVSATPDSVNTPIGIAKFIETEINQETQILIIEMGEHYKGDVAEICDMARPDIGVITGVNESHLERLHNLKTSIETVFELAQGVKESGVLVLNADDHNVRENFSNFVGDKKKYFYSSENNRLSRFQTTDYKISTEDLMSYFNICDEGKILVGVKSKILGEYIRGMALAVMIVAKELGQPRTNMIIGLEKLKPISHRLEPIVNPNGLIVIDDSYNGNPNGVKEAIKLLDRFKGHRKVYLTPGLVEMGSKAKEVHEEIGKNLANSVDLVLLVRNSVTPYIEHALIKNGFANSNIIWYDTAQEAHKSLDKVLQKGDVILFQNDWGDQYL